MLKNLSSLININKKVENCITPCTTDTDNDGVCDIDDLDDHFIGVMGIAFNDKEHKLSKEEWIFIRQKVGAIGSLLTDYLRTKK